MSRKKDERVLADLEANGFDRCEIDEEEGGVYIGCSQCDALAINGVACHETGCPRVVREVDDD